MEYSNSQKIRNADEQKIVIKMSNLIRKINSEKRILIIDHLKLNTEK